MGFEILRKEMVKEQLERRGIRDKDVLRAFLTVPREEFVPAGDARFAYDDTPLPVGYGQTISQPYMVALMTELLHAGKGGKVLEIGTGSGYQAAILAEIGYRVYSVERLEVLAEKAKSVLERLGYDVRIKVDDGTLGWPEFAPYDDIIVTAGAPDVPGPLVDQLGEGGRLVIPVGDMYLQELVRVTKKKSGTVRENFGGCQFVPLKGEKGWNEQGTGKQ